MATADKIKLIVAALIVLLGVVGFYYFGNQSAWLRGLVLVAAGITAVVIALVSAPGRATVEFSRESYRELQKVVWPTRKETIQTTLVVVVIVVVVALFLWFIDWSLLKIVKAVTGQRS